MTSRAFTFALCGTAIILAVVPMASATGQSPAAKPASAPAIAYVKVSGVDYAFQAPATVPSGIVTFNLENNGSDLHAMAVFELPEKHTMREFLDQYHTHGMIPVWMTSFGQTATIAPKAETFLTVRLKPGRYILACLIPARDGRVHTEKGMVTLVTAK